MVNMGENGFVPKSIAVAWHPSLDEAKIIASEVTDVLRGHSVPRVDSFSLNDEEFRERLQEGRYDLTIALGGDGTMLRAGKLCAPVSVPVMGINLGHFGFLIETQRDEWRDRIDDLLAGEWETDRRMMIRAEHYHEGKLLNVWDALNDVVIARGLNIRPVHLNVRINDISLAEYVADGLILATATGSTSYAQSVGGPILRPDMRNMVLVPIASNLCVDRSLVLLDSDTVNVTVSGYVETIVSADGHDVTLLDFGDRICISASEHSALFVRFQDKGVFYRNVTRYMQRNPTIKGVRE